MTLTSASYLRDGNFRAQINVLDSVQQLHTFLHRALERFPAGDEPGAACTLIDYRGGHCFFKIICAGSAATVDQPGAAHEAVGHLVAAEIDGMIAGELGVDALINFSVT